MPHGTRDATSQLPSILVGMRLDGKGFQKAVIRDDFSPHAVSVQAAGRDSRIAKSDEGEDRQVKDDRSVEAVKMENLANHDGRVRAEKEHQLLQA
jgi:hypothetical protein